MAENQNSVVINIGSQRISMAIFEVSKSGGLILKSYDSETIGADPAHESARIAQTRVAIAELTKRLKPGKVKARYAVSGQAVFTRFVKLPPLQDDNIEQLVTFEAQQHVPFPLNEVVWDYELIDGASDKEAVIVAIKEETLDEINAAVNDNGLTTAEVDVSPMAIYNAFHATYGNPEEPILLIDIGAKTSNLLYIEGNRFFTRSVNIGGASVTASIAKEYNVPFLEAEQQKITNGLVALGGGHTEQLDEAVAALAMVIRNALSRLPSEIARTTNYYRSQHGGSAPRRVILAGGGAVLPYTLEFFQEKLNLPVEFFNPVRNVAIGKDVNASVVQREGHLMGELVGLGLRSIGKSAINIDLVPGVVAKLRAADRRKPFLVAAAAIALLGMAGWTAFQAATAAKAEDRHRTMIETRDALAPLNREIDKLAKKENALRQIATEYTDAEAGHTAWLDVLTEIRGAFASDALWLTSFEPISGFDVQKALETKKDAKAKEENGKPIVKEEFYNNAYGTTSMLTPPRPAPAAPVQQPKRRSKNAPSVEPVPKLTANAVRIRGYWRKNPKDQTIVSDLLNRLREKSDLFVLKVKNEKGTEVELNEHILTAAISGEKPGQIGFSFEITLPLANEIPVE
ncbi:MAG: type IV pilus assembly protein PilM [Verrucomicrobiota bacterium]